MNNPSPSPSNSPAMISGRRVKWFFLFASYAGAALLGVGLLRMLSGFFRGEALFEGQILYTCGAFLFLAGHLCLPAWMYLVWEDLPPESRVSRSGRVLSPGAAALLFFVPLYNLYWLFAGPLSVCDAIDRELERFDEERTMPRGRAIATAIVHLLPLLNLVVGPALWFAFFASADRTRAVLREKIDDDRRAQARAMDARTRRNMDVSYRTA